MNLPLTEKQEALWRFIASCERSPSFDEMMVAMGTASRSFIFGLLDALEERGFIRRIRNRARSIIALDPTKPKIADFKTSELFAELERRGVLLGCAR